MSALASPALPAGRAAVSIVDIREKTVSVASPIRNAVVDFSQMTASIVAVVTDVIRDGKPVIGYGFSSNGRYAAGGLLRERFIPRIRRANPSDLVDEGTGNLDPFAIWKVAMQNEKPGGHGERSVAIGVLDMAIWDAVAKIEGVPLYRLLADRYRRGVYDQKVFVYAAGGYYYPGKDIAGLKDEFRSYLDRGYTQVKMKIGGVPLDEDLPRIEAAIEVLGDASKVAVDANGRFDLRTALAYADAIQPYGLAWYEEPCDPLDYQLHAVVSSAYGLPMATGENLFSHQDARNLLRYGGMRPDRDWVQFDCALSYGLVDYMRTLDVMDAHGWSARRCIPHGGHQLSLAIAAGLGLGGNESYPDVFFPFNGFADETPVEGGYIALSDAPGVGLERKSNLYETLRTLGG